jgi:hypothetical protein
MQADKKSPATRRRSRGNDLGGTSGNLCHSFSTFRLPQQNVDVLFITDAVMYVNRQNHTDKITMPAPGNEGKPLSPEGGQACHALAAHDGRA